jgi:undecaprenyl-diphosphatase
MAEVQPPLTAPVEESIGPRDLTHWHTRLGRRLVDLVSSLVGVAHRWTMLVTLLVAGLVVVGLTALSSEVYSSVTDDGELAGLDQPVLDAAVATRTPFNQTALTVFTDIGGPVGMPILASALVALMVWRWKSWSPLVLTLAAAAGSLAMTTVGKHLIGRSRPPRELAVPPFESSPSFPSGHTLNATVIIGVLVYLWLLHLTTQRARWWAVGAGALFVISMGLSRVYLGHHWLTDVIAGWLLGLAWLTVVVTAHRLHLTIRRRRERARTDPAGRPQSHAAGGLAPGANTTPAR